MQKSNCIFSYSSDTDKTVLTVTLVGDIDHHGAVGVRSEIDEEIARHRPAETVIVLSGIDFMDSSGIGLVMGRYAKMKAIGGELVLRGANERLMRIFKMAGLERIVRIEETDEEEENEGERN